MASASPHDPAGYGPRPRASAEFFKGHGHGNDYVVFLPGDAWTVTAPAVQAVCDAHRGVAGDGIVVVTGAVPIPSLRMFNPDGGEFERSGNGLRIAALALRRAGLVSSDAFDVAVGGGDVRLEIVGEADDGWDVSAALGVARTGPAAIGWRVTLPDRSAAAAEADTAGSAEVSLHTERGVFSIVPVSVGNPHAVLFTDDLSDAALEAIGPIVAQHPDIPLGTNVQLATVQSDGIRIRIWERGVGRTSASGTSASAVAVAAVRTQRAMPGEHVIHMDGGAFHVTVDASLGVTLRGPVHDVAEGRLTAGFLERVARVGGGRGP